VRSISIRDYQAFAASGLARFAQSVSVLNSVLLVGMSTANLPRVFTRLLGLIAAYLNVRRTCSISLFFWVIP
jgi:hypothetical protein